MIWCCLAVAIPAISPAASNDDKSTENPALSAINSVLDDWHRAAASADEEHYFRHLADESVFLGTDATERWNREAFRKYVHPHFSKGKGWTFKSVRRNVTISADGKIAWFDEDLKTQNLGPCRGSGVLVLDGNDWKIAQYNLTVPIPNDVFKEVKKIIEAALKGKKEEEKKGAN